MRSPIASKWCQLAVAFLLLAPPIAGARARVEQGRGVLNGVRAMHLVIDFGGEALELDQMDPLALALKLSPEEEKAELGSDEWNVRRSMLPVERLGRDMIADIPALIALMSRLDRAARTVPDLHYQTDRTMSRVTFAAERLLFFADPDEPKLPELRQALVAELRKCASGPFGEPIIAALEYFDPDHVEVTALALAADTKAEPNARRIAVEILGRAKNLQHVQPLLAVFEDDGNATNGPVGLHAAWATSKILAAADRADAQVAALAQRAADKLERIGLGGGRLWSTNFLRVLIRLDSDRGVKICSSLALDGKLDYLKRSIALDYIARDAKPNRDLAMSLKPLLDVSLPDSRATANLHIAAAGAMARLLGLEHDESGASGRTSVEERVRRELEKAPRLK